MTLKRVWGRLLVITIAAATLAGITERGLATPRISMTARCRLEDGGGMTCSPMSGGCSHELEKCTTAADCCDSGYDCVNGKCAQPPPPK
jgi:hypothetical protein